jgi:hypothetical protein
VQRKRRNKKEPYIAALFLCAAGMLSVKNWSVDTILFLGFICDLSQCGKLIHWLIGNFPAKQT